MNNLVLFCVVLLIYLSFCYLSYLLYSYLDPEYNFINHHLGSKTPYRFINHLSEKTRNEEFQDQGCKDIKIWMVIRHGTRFPSSDEIKEINDTLMILKSNILYQNSIGYGKLNTIQRNSFFDWFSNLETEQAKKLTWQGQEEMVLLARRMKKRFKNLLNKNYSKKYFSFGYTDTERTQESAKYFTIGLFNMTESKNVTYLPAAETDRTIRFYKHCDRWLRQVKRNPDTYKEQHLFGNSSEMFKGLHSVSSRFGFDKTLDLDDVNLMYKTCGYETAWYKNRPSPWCYAFDEQSIKILEYYEDLKLYWRDGYGYELTYKQACLAIKHMFETFRNEGSPNATFFFAHSGTILKMLGHLQLYKPESHLRSDNFNEKRKWRASKIDAFASNIAFVLFKCKDDYYVLTLHQENIIKLPMCQQELCPLKLLLEYFHDSIHNCNFEKMCSLGT